MLSSYEYPISCIPSQKASLSRGKKLKGDKIETNIAGACCSTVDWLEYEMKRNSSKLPVRFVMFLLLEILFGSRVALVHEVLKQTGV